MTISAIWTLADINGAAGQTLHINADPNRGHLDFNGKQWTGDDFKLIRDLEDLPDFPSTKRRAAELIGFKLRAQKEESHEDERKKWEVIPVPADAPAPLEPRPYPGERHDERHCYLDEERRIIRYVDRYVALEIKEGKDKPAKRFQPLTLRQPPEGPPQWVPYPAPDPQPLYGQDKLPGAETVLLVEGEKKADRGQAIAPAGCAVLSIGNSTNCANVDYAPLKGRVVRGWPDADRNGGGLAAMIKALDQARAAGAESVHLVDVPASYAAFKDGWDLGNDFPDDPDDPDGSRRMAKMLSPDAPLPVPSPPKNTQLNIVNAGVAVRRQIPPRQWLLGNVFCSNVLSCLIAHGGVGKTALRLLQLMSVAIGRPLTGDHVFRLKRVMLVCLEDDVDELDRRIQAACIYHDVDYSELDGWLYYCVLPGVKLAELHGGSPQVGPLDAMIREAVVAYDIGLASFDPMVKLHDLEENNNMNIDFVATLLAKIAQDLKIATDVVHHTRKGTAEAGNTDAARGAVALIDGGRLAYTLVRMTLDEASLYGVDEAERELHIRMDRGKVNLAPPDGKTKWYKLVGVPLKNSDETYPAGDNIQTAEPWMPPSLWADVSTMLQARVRRVV